MPAYSWCLAPCQARPSRCGGHGRCLRPIMARPGDTNSPHPRQGRAVSHRLFSAVFQLRLLGAQKGPKLFVCSSSFEPLPSAHGEPRVCRALARPLPYSCSADVWPVWSTVVRPRVRSVRHGSSSSCFTCTYVRRSVSLASERAPCAHRRCLRASPFRPLVVAQSRGMWRRRWTPSPISSISCRGPRGCGGWSRRPRTRDNRSSLSQAILGQGVPGIGPTAAAPSQRTRIQVARSTPPTSWLSRHGHALSRALTI